MLPPTSALGTRTGDMRVTLGTDVDVGGGPEPTSVSETQHGGPVLPDRGGRVSG